jgi:hypothetical protein
MKKLPKARTENLLEQNLENETLIYDLLIDKAFNLNETLSAVYKACGRNQTFDDLKRRYKFSDDFIYLALDKLKRNNLLSGKDYVSPFADGSRREVIKKVGLASMMVLPIITGLVAPKAVNAASGDGSAGLGAYNQACLPGNSCYGSFQCSLTTLGENRCCENNNTPGIRHYSGESETQTSSSPIYLSREAAAASDNTSCQSSLVCCNGASATGTCTYAPDTLNEYSPAEYEQFEVDNSYPYLQTCNCTCP